MKIHDRIFLLLDKIPNGQRLLANEINVSEKIVSSWKTRGSNPSAEYISSIADFLQVSTDYLLTGEEPQIQNIHSFNDDENQLINMYRLLTDREQGEFFGELRATTKKRPNQSRVYDDDVATNIMKIAVEEANEFLRTKT